MTMTTTATIQSSDIGTRATTRTLGELLGLDSKTTKKSRHELEAIPFPLVKVVVRTRPGATRPTHAASSAGMACVPPFAAIFSSHFSARVR